MIGCWLDKWPYEVIKKWMSYKFYIYWKTDNGLVLQWLSNWNCMRKMWVWIRKKEIKINKRIIEKALGLIISGMNGKLCIKISLFHVLIIIKTGVKAEKIIFFIIDMNLKKKDKATVLPDQAIRTGRNSSVSSGRSFPTHSNVFLHFPTVKFLTCSTNKKKSRHQHPS